MSNTVVGLFESMEKAKQVKQTLMSEGMSESQIEVMANDEDGSAYQSATANEDGYTDIGSGGGTGIGEKISHFFRSLAGGDDDAHHHFAEGINGGGALVAVTTDSDNADQIALMLKQHGARDIKGDDDVSSDDLQTSDAPAGQTTIPVVAEELVVGKREVNRGGVRVYSRTVETPVESDISLRDEQIVLERRKADRPATAADFASGQDSMIELTAMGEEAVVGKTSRVVEEVLVGKQTSEHTEQIRDTVRHTEVEVERIAGDTQRTNR